MHSKAVSLAHSNTHIHCFLCLVVMFNSCVGEARQLILSQQEGGLSCVCGSTEASGPMPRHHSPGALFTLSLCHANFISRQPTRHKRLCAGNLSRARVSSELCLFHFEPDRGAFDFPSPFLTRGTEDLGDWQWQRSRKADGNYRAKCYF